MRRILFIVLLSLSVGGSKLVVSSNPPVPGAPSPPAAAIAPERASPGITARQIPEKVAVDAITPGTTTPVINDALQDTEPVVISVQRNNAPYVVTAYIKFDANATQYDPKARINFAATSNFSNWQPAGQLPISMGFDRSGDPMCSANPFSSGVHPRSIYCVGVMSFGSTTTQQPAPLTYTQSAIGLWRYYESDSTFQAPVPMQTVANPRFLDKPSVAVSWHSGTLGQVYVAAVDVPTRECMTDCTDYIRLYRSIDGDNYTSIPLDPATFSGDQFHSPIVLVDGNNGDVYLLWLSWITNKIYLARSTTGGSTWGPRQEIDAGSASEPFAKPGMSNVCDSHTQHCFSVRSMLMARYNWITRSIGVVWHRHDAPGPPSDEVPTDVKYTHYDTITQSWGLVQPVNEIATKSQWNPALDYDESGAYLITYYDGRLGSTHDSYQLFASHLDALGNRLEPDQRLSDDTPGKVTNYPEELATLGEYQDLWYSGGTWYAAWIDVPAQGQGNPYITRPSVSAIGSPAPSFYLLTPCRLIDTRLPDGPYGGPAVPNDGTRVIQATGACGIPSTAKALALNVVAILGPADGTFTAYPTDKPRPPWWTLRYKSGMVRANNATVPLSQSGQLSVYNINGAGATGLIIDVTGYFQ